MTLTIKDHIERGHYPKDEKGRALVPMRSGGTAIVVATDAPHDVFPIIGWTAAMGTQRCWQAGGRNNLCAGESPHDLLPPPPRKVVVKRWGLIDRSGKHMSCLLYNTRDEAERIAKSNEQINRLVELTGSYEEPWE